jgi:hypothetical protein
MERYDYKPGTREWFDQQARQARSIEAQYQAKEQKKRDAKRDKRLEEYRGFQQGQFDDLTRGFRQFSEAQTGRALGNVLRQQEVGATRRGIAFSGLAGHAAAGAQAALQGTALGAQQGFASQLATMQSQNYDRALQGEFQYAMEIDRMFLSHQFNKELIHMQEKLAQDRESRDSFWGLAGSIGGWLGGGPLGAAAGNWLGNQLGGGGGGGYPSYQAQPYGVA